MVDQQSSGHADATSLESGVWEGEFLDASGQRATVRLHVPEGQERGETRFELVFKTEDEPYVVGGPCVVRNEGRQVVVEVPVRGGDDDERAMVRYSGILSDAGTYARQAMFGVVEDAPVDGLRGGVFMAFRHEERERQDVPDAGCADTAPPLQTVDDVLRRMRRRIGRIRLPVIRGRR